MQGGTRKDIFKAIERLQKEIIEKQNEIDKLKNEIASYEEYDQIIKNAKQGIQIDKIINSISDNKTEMEM